MCAAPDTTWWLNFQAELRADQDFKQGKPSKCALNMQLSCSWPFFKIWRFRGPPLYESALRKNQPAAAAAAALIIKGERRALGQVRSSFSACSQQKTHLAFAFTDKKERETSRMWENENYIYIEGRCDVHVALRRFISSSSLLRGWCFLVYQKLTW